MSKEKLELILIYRLRSWQLISKMFKVRIIYQWGCLRKLHQICQGQHSICMHHLAKIWLYLPHLCIFTIRLVEQLVQIFMNIQFQLPHWNILLTILLIFPLRIQYLELGLWFVMILLHLLIYERKFQGNF